MLDIRHEPTDQDLLMYNWIKSFNFSGIVIATKADKISRGKYQSNLRVINNKLKVKDTSLIIPYSSSKHINKDKVWNVFEELLIKEKEQQSQ